ncbi:MAG: hypothetical protein SFV54_11655 [Bryobacteraceae bacterium]|nr:hypothetical protein [Bryobacteraceae bacterium]
MTTLAGPGASPDAEVAVTAIQLDRVMEISFVELFAGLTLPAGTYYLTIQGSAPGGGRLDWRASGVVNATVLTTAVGVSDLGYAYAERLHAYPPAGLIVSGSPNGLAMVVTGTPAVVPEPSGFLLTLAALPLLAGYRVLKALRL